MIEQILPQGVRVAEAYADADAVLPAVEAAAVARAVPSRRREFATTRALARQALAELGRPVAAIPSGPRGEPRWPEGVIGSLTHCAGYRAAAVALRGGLLSLGIDAEPDAPLPDGVLAAVTGPAERAAVAAGPPHADRILFSAKESVFKAWYPLAGAMLDFTEAHLDLDPAGGFTAHLLVPGPVVAGRRLARLHGRWRRAGGLILTAAAVHA
ncbi:4'-phosphopantetheinyl transferase family protein [Catellatospora vulcania]|uniref:4'-phosphopantetheinyl transferase family protein n=1 Tax=Catellatospora vulcania TaxID=1460450 RepID=UPI0012D46D07|nr:4'-phosphopantetheinyl transferase superfamily protein [Catellatospora vulcania]